MKKKDLKIINDIQKEAAKRYGDKLYKTQPKADVMIEVVNKALGPDKDKFDKNTLDKLQTIKDSKMLEGDEKIIDPKVEREIDMFTCNEIDKAIKEGRLSDPNKDPFIKKLKQKQRRYAKRIK